MATSLKTLSLTRPAAPEREYGSTVWQFPVGLALAVTGTMLVLAWFIISAIVASWVSDQDPALVGRITAYQAWLLPVTIGSIAIAKIGIAIVLWGIVRRLWIRVAGLKEALPTLIKQHSTGTPEGGA